MKVSLEHKQIVGDLANLSEKNAEALIAYGADMYQKGIFRGLRLGFMCAATGAFAVVGITMMRKMKREQKQETERFNNEIKNWSEQFVKSVNDDTQTNTQA